MRLTLIPEESEEIISGIIWKPDFKWTRVGIFVFVLGTNRGNNHLSIIFLGNAFLIYLQGKEKKKKSMK